MLPDEATIKEIENRDDIKGLQIRHIDYDGLEYL